MRASRKVVLPVRDSAMSSNSEETVSDDSKLSERDDEEQSDTDADSLDGSLSSGTQSFMSAAIAFSS